MSQYERIKQECYEANMLLPKSGLVIQTFGNVSSFDQEKGVFAIKPSGIPYSDLELDQMVVVDLNAKVVEGSLNPSSDTKTHAVLYQNYPQLRGICHTHSTYATSWAQAMKPIEIFGTTHADHIPIAIPCSEVMSDDAVERDYELETGKQILDLLKNRSVEEIEMVLVAGHGPFTWGKSALKAVDNSIVLEQLAQMALLTLQINPNQKPLKSSLIHKHYFRKHGKNASYGQR